MQTGCWINSASRPCWPTVSRWAVASRAAIPLGAIRGRFVVSAQQRRLAAKNSDRKTFFADEDALRKRYLKDSGLDAMPTTLDVYLPKSLPQLWSGKSAEARWR